MFRIDLSQNRLARLVQKRFADLQLGRVRQRGVIWSVALGHRQAALAVMCRG